MPILAIVLLLIGAVLHTTWNLLLKRARDKYATSWWMLITGGAVASLALLFTGFPPREMWGYILFSMLTEAAYFIILTYAYHDNEFSLVYPIARGAAPAFLALWSFLFLDERPTGGGAAGLLMIVGGLIVIGVSASLQVRVTRLRFNGIAVALVIALLISIYTTIDGAAVKGGFAFPYVMTMFALVPFPVTPFVLRRYGWARLREVWNEQGLMLALIGVIGVAAYLMAVLAYSIAPIGYSGAVREVSVVIGAFAGWKFLGEKLGGTRVFGAIIIFAGILVIAVYG